MTRMVFDPSITFRSDPYLVEGVVGHGRGGGRWREAGLLGGEVGGQVGQRPQLVSQDPEQAPCYVHPFY